MSQYREIVLKNFWDKLKEAKRQNAKDIRLSLKEMDDLGFVIFELLSQHYNNTVQEKPSQEDDNEEKLSLSGGGF